MTDLPEPLKRLLALARADVWTVPVGTGAVTRSITERLGLRTIAAVEKLEAAADLV
jgi:hypothetical protein